MASRKEQPTDQSKRTKTAQWVRTFWRVVAYGFGAVLLLFIYLSTQLPSFRKLEDPTFLLASNVYAADGSTLGTYYQENRTPVKYEEISKHVIDALIATEDKRFYQHSGIDSRALGRVVVKTILGQDQSAGGGSTISQQLAKLLMGRPNTSKMFFLRKGWVMVTTKLKEWLTAVKLERKYTKEEIIAMYLNQFDYLYGANGIKSAAKIYFGKEPIDLNIQESAVLVGMLQNPSSNNPIRFPERAMKRREVVLKHMMEQGFLSASDKRAQEMYDSLRQTKIDITKFKPIDHNEGLAQHFREYLRIHIRDLLKKEELLKPNGEAYDLYTDGLKIYTTIDPRMQAHAEAAAREHLSFLQPIFYKHWEKMDPWTHPIPNGNETQVPIYARKAALNRLIWESPRFQIAQENIYKRVNELEIRPVDIDRMMEIEETEREKAGSGKEKIERWVKTKYITRAQYDKYLSTMKGADWGTIKKEFRQMEKHLKTPVKMKVFAYNDKNEIDTIMSPYDSIRYHRMVLQTGMAAIEPQTGHVKAWVGGTGFRYFKFDHVNKEARRQIGSTIKPLLYAFSFDLRGFYPCYICNDVKVCIGPGDGRFGMSSTWCPKNAGGGYSGGSMSLIEGLRNSVNTCSAMLMKDLGSTGPFREFLANVGIDTSFVPAQPSICLGTPDLSVLEMAGAYTIFANEGMYSAPVFITRIEDKNGNEIWRAKQIPSQALAQKAIYQMVYMLKENVRKSPGFAFKSQVGGKTGTTNDQSDGWFMGVTPNLVVATWTGCDDRFLRFRNMTYGQGAKLARPIFQKFLTKVENDREIGFDVAAEFKKPEDSPEFDCGSYPSTPGSEQIYYYSEEDEGYGDGWDLDPAVATPDSLKKKKTTPAPAPAPKKNTR